MATLAEARRAKDAVISLLEHHEAVNGVGVARVEDGYAVKINLSRPLAGPALPTAVEDVPVIWEVVGEVHKR